MGKPEGITFRSKNVAECDYRMGELKADRSRGQFIPTPQECLDLYRDIYSDGQVSSEEQLIINSLPMRVRVSADFGRWIETVDKKKVYAEIFEKSQDPEIKQKLKLIPQPGEDNSLGGVNYGAIDVLGQIDGEDFTAKQARDLVKSIMAEALGVNVSDIQVSLKPDYTNRVPVPATAFEVSTPEKRIIFTGKELDRLIQNAIKD